MSWTYRCLIVPDTHVALARELTATVVGAPGAGMYTTPLSPTGEMPATHWISAGLIQGEFAGLLPLTTHGEEVTTTPGNAAVVAHLAGEAEMSVTAADVQELFDVSDITEQAAQEAWGRLGLTLASAPAEAAQEAPA